MGVEPTGACCSQPPTDFEDQGRHRATSTPTVIVGNFNFLATSTKSLTRLSLRAIFFRQFKATIAMTETSKQAVMFQRVRVGASRTH